MNGKERKVPVYVDDEAFVRAWQSAETLDDAVKLLGMTTAAAKARSAVLRKLGIPCRKFPSMRGRRTPEEIKRLKSLAEALSLQRQTKQQVRS